MGTGVSQRTHERTAGRRQVAALKVPALHPQELASVFSMAVDLAEGRPMGHAQRVCYVAVRLAREAGMSKPEQAAVYYGALLHDIGVAEAAAQLPALPSGREDDLFSRLPLATPDEALSGVPEEDQAAVLQAFVAHCSHGAATAGTLGLPDAAAEAVRYHHERWDGSGFPEGLAREDIPPAARVVAAADYIEAFIASDRNPLLARSAAVEDVASQAGRALDPDLAGFFAVLAHRDDFWLGLFDDRLDGLLPGMVQDGLRPSRRAVMRFAEVLADVVDSRTPFMQTHSRRAASLSRKMAEHLGLGPDHVELVGVAALLQNVGSLEVPKRVVAKPDILTLEERDLLYQHPERGRDVISRLPGMDHVAEWVGAHHERPDGKGYPEGLAGEDLPLESRILAVADVYEALTRRRPHRTALPRGEAVVVIEGLAGTQLDGAVVEALRAVV